MEEGGCWDPSLAAEGILPVRLVLQAWEASADAVAPAAAAAWEEEEEEASEVVSVR